MAKGRAADLGQSLTHRERTRTLLELGELLETSGLPALLQGDRAIMLAALRQLVERAGADLDGATRAWRRRNESEGQYEDFAAALRRAVKGPTAEVGDQQEDC